MPETHQHEHRLVCEVLPAQQTVKVLRLWSRCE
jgi:hypothetical protein